MQTNEPRPIAATAVRPSLIANHVTGAHTLTHTQAAEPLICSMDKYIEQQGVPLTPAERSAIQQCQADITRSAGYGLAATTPLAALIAHTLQPKGNKSKLITFGVGILSGIGVAGYMAIQQSPKCYQRLMQLPADSQLRAAVYGQMLEYNPALADRVIHRLHDAKQQEQTPGASAATPPAPSR